MVTTIKSSNHHSSSLPQVQSVDISSSNFPRKNLPSPWAQVVRCGESESVAVIHPSPPSTSSSCSSLNQAFSSDSSPKVIPASPPMDNFNTVVVANSSNGAEDDADRYKKPVWNKPSNGVVVETGPVMGAESWPELSASAKGSPKLPAESPSKTLNGSHSTSQGLMTSQASPKQATTNTKVNPVAVRQRSMKRVGGSGIVSGPSQNNFSNTPPPPPPPFPIYQLPPVSYGMIPVVPEPAPRDHYRNWDPRPMVGGFLPGMNDYRGSSHRTYFGHNPRGDASYHNGYGNRHDQDRRNYGNTRDTFVPQPRMPPRGLLRHPPPSPPAFVGPQPIGPFANPMGFSEFYYYQPVTMEQFTGMPYFTPTPAPPTFISATDSPLSNMILRQIEYYFSDSNLVRDQFLRSKMDEQGWVHVTLIADFPRVKSLTTNVQLILDSMRTSTIVEVLGDKLRRHNDWMRWLSTKTRSESTSTSSSPSGSRSNNLTANFQAMTLEETAESCSLPQLSNGGATGSNS